MTIAWMRGGAVAVALSLAGGAAQSAIITDATFDLNGTYVYDSFRYELDGSFAGALLGDPTVTRDYDLGLTISLSGRTVFDDTLSIGEPFSIADATRSLVSAPGFGVFLGILSGVTDDVTFDRDSVSGDFAFALDYLTSTVLKFASCFSLFSGGCAHSGTFAVAMNLSYEGDSPGDPAPVPLPAGLPLLGAGLAALALLRRRRG